MRIKVHTVKVTYDLDFKRSVSVIRGESGTGKTYLSVLLEQYQRLKGSSGVSITCDRHVTTVLEDPVNYNTYIAEHCNDVVFLDEEVAIRKASSLLRGLKDAGAWIVVISRKDSKKKYVECAVDSVYSIHTSGKYKYLKQVLDIVDVRKWSD